MIEQIKQELAYNFKSKFTNWNYNKILNEFDLKEGFEKGFDACMELELPIKFAEWIADSKKHGYSKQLYEAMIINKVKNTKELFNYWIQNVYNK